MRIRELGHDELEEALAVWRDAGLPLRPAGRDARASLERELRETRNFLLGAFDDDALVGVVLGSDDGRKGWVNRLAVRPSHQHRGLARALIEACEERFRAAGIGLSCCLIEEGNDASFALFAEAGYEVRRDITYLRKPLSGPDW